MRSRGGRRLLGTLVLPAAVVLLATVGVPDVAWAKGDASAYLDKLESGRSAVYEARQLVVNLRPPQSAAVVDVRMTPTGRFVRAQTESDVTRVWSDPQHALVSADGMALEDTTPDVVPLRKQRILDKYDVSVEAPQALLGTPVVPLGLVRREDRRLVERIWVDPATGVVYRRELYGAKGAVVGIVTTLEMRWGRVSAPEPYRGQAPDQVGLAARRGAPVRLPFGYDLVSSSKLDAGGRPATHWLYSDGLHALSVFRMAGGMRRPEGYAYRRVALGRSAGWSGPGPATWVWEGAGATWTMVGEESQLDAVRLTSAFPRGGRSMLAKMGSWWSHAVRWVGRR